MIQRSLLRGVARSYGLQCSYKNVQNEVVWSPDTTLKKLLEDFTKIQINTNDDLIKIMDLKKEMFFKAKINKCHVFWGGKSTPIKVRSTDELPIKLKIEIHLENSEIVKSELIQLSYRKSSDGNKATYKLNEILPIGYHKLLIETSSGNIETFLICPPEKLNAPKAHAWGPFVPLYALKSSSDWGIGSFKEAAELAKEMKSFGGSWMGLLPMLATNFDYPDCDPSPYSSLSRLFWNEIYLDVESLIKKYENKEALALISTENFKEKILTLRKKAYVDYYSVYQLKKEVLLILSDAFFKNQLDSKAEYLKFAVENPDIDSYASFRTNDLRNQNFHKFVQFEMNNTLKGFASENDFGLYMDYPVGVNDGGYDFKKYRSVFLGEVSVGAPPEPVFALGQDWGFPAFHPTGMQEDNYNYFRKSLQHHLKFCKILRLDHIMGLHRIYSVPKKFKGNEGVYLKFPPEELFAVVILEAHRAGADLIGENLGTVPLAVEKIIKERNLNGMWVLQCETWRTPTEAFNAIKENSLVCVNTHDMPMLESYKNGSDLELVESLNILSSDYKIQFSKERLEQINNWKKSLGNEEFTLNAIKNIAGSSAKYFVVNLEDFWGEIKPQNIPGTWKEYPNWRKKFTQETKVWMKDKNVLTILNALKEKRKH